MTPWRSETLAPAPAWLRYGLAVVSVALALVLSLLLTRLSVNSPFLLFFAAIAFSAWYGGLRPGLLASALSVLMSLYFFLPPASTLAVDDLTTLIRVVIFILVATLINLLSEARNRAESAARAQSARLQVTLASIGDAVIATDTEGRVTFMNQVAENLTGWPQAEALGKDLAAVFRIINEETRAPVENPTVRVLREGQITGLANHTLLVARDGAEHPIDDSGAPIRNEGQPVAGAVLIFRDISARRRALAEREALLAREQAARAEAEAAQERFAFLAEASEVLASSLDYETTLAAVARMAVPRVADWCTVDVVMEDGTVEQLAVTHVDPAKVAWAHKLRERYPPDPTAPSGVYNVIRTGKPEILPELTEAMLVAAARDEEQLAIIREIGFTSVITMPLQARDRTLGALTFVSAESGHLYSDDDTALAEDLARRAALAIDNARLYREAQAERQRFYTTLASIGDAVIATDTEGCITFMNAIAERLTGWPLAAARGHAIAEVFHIVNEQTRQPVESPVDRVIREGMVVGLANHTVLIARDGGERAIDDSGAPIHDESGKLIGVVLVFRDIQERRQAETRERFLTDVTAALATSLDYETILNTIARLMTPALADNCIIDIVEAGGLLRRVAVAAADPAEEEMLHELQHRLPPDSGGISARRAIETRRPVLIPEITDSFWDHLDFAPEHIPLLRAFQPRSLLVVPFVVSERVLGSIMLNMTQSRRQYTDADLTLIEEVARRAALAIDNARLYREAQAAIATRDQFLSIASHELKTPLTSLMAAAQLLQRRTERDGVLNPRDRRTMQLVVEQSARLNRMVLSLLDLSRIETGQLSIERVPLDLVDLVRRLVEEAQPALERHRIQLDLPAQPLLIEGDALRLEQVVQNLLNNAAKYSMEDTTITVRVAQQAGTACLAVTDQGIGIPESARTRLFQRFYRAPNVDAQISGMGIGLYVVKEIVTLHGGQIDVAGTEGQGSTFTVCLPLAPA